MADYRDVMDATTVADNAQSALETYCGQIEDAERVGDMALVVGLAAVAVCERLNALTVRLDFLAHDAKR